MEGEIIKTSSGYSVIKFLIKNWYWFLVIFVTLPLLISTIREAYVTNNPSLPFAKVGLSVFNADTTLYNDVETMKTNPALLVGIEYPNLGYWRKAVYYWVFFWNVIFHFFALLILITVPFMIFYKIFKLKNSTETMKNLLLSFISGLIFMFLFNLIFTIHNIIRGNLILTPPDANVFQELWWIIRLTMPFHGIVNFILYLVGLFR